MAVDVLLGLQWGDEGKGKIVDSIAANYDVIARFQGGPNAGHTLIIDGKKVVLHTIPSGIFHDGIANLIGSGVVIDPITLQKEIATLTDLGLDVKSRLYISHKAHLILPSHKILDAASEAAKGVAKIGSTLKGIGPTYMDKTGRNGLRVGDILRPDFKDVYDKIVAKHKRLLLQFDYAYTLEDKEAEWMAAIDHLREYNLVDSAYYVNDKLQQGCHILAEGAQGAMLDIDFGTYPYVTSSNTVASSACIGLGIAPQHIREVIGITKAYCTRVGGGPFPTELFDELGEQMQTAGQEFGATTGRPRRCGWIDLPALQYAIMLSGVTQLAVTKVDVLDDFEKVKVCTAYKINGQETTQLPFDINSTPIDPVYETFPGWQQSLDGVAQIDELPDATMQLLRTIEQQTGIKVSMVSTGPSREQLLTAPVSDLAF